MSEDIDEGPPDDSVPEAQVIPIEEGRKTIGPKPPAWRARLTKKNGEVKCNVANLITLLVHEPLWDGLHSWDEFAQTIVTTRRPVWDEDFAPKSCEQGEWTEADDVRLAAWFSRQWKIDPTPAQVRQAVDICARRRSVNPLQEYIHGLTWDGVPRLDTWLSVYLGVTQSAYAASAGRKMLIGAIARALRPGCKLDTMVVLEGPQGARKSSAIASLFGRDWSSDTPPDLQSKDRFLGLRGRWGVEYAELDGMGKAETDRIKSFLSSSIDDYRPPYARGYVKVPRTSILIGTVNGSEYLRDITGNRRFWPVRVGRIDLDALGRDRDQLWAEARSNFEDGKPWWVDAEEASLFATEQADRVHVDEWLSRIEVWCGLGSSIKPFVTVGDVLSYELSIEPGKWSQGDQNRAARCLMQLGRVRTRERSQSRRWGYAVHSYTIGSADGSAHGPVVPVQQELTGTEKAQ